MVRINAKIAAEGQITLPAAVREALRVTAGDTVSLPSSEPGRLVRFAGAHRLDARGMSPDESNAWLRELRGHDECECSLQSTRTPSSTSSPATIAQTISP